ncbi:DNA-directed RNA polymerase III, subunit Rpc31 [Dipodascopsis tothii]|uniref:DNA-directed RNA polymerase III, subunit Rpc31 n=1 Tax=Dipodascopsis tothii TaxID=44089 RepID=UPI0034CFE610
MSGRGGWRGGRGGFRGGRGGLRGGAVGGSVFGPEVEVDYAPTEQYPKVTLPLQTAMNEFEKRCASQMVQFQNEIRQSAFYVVEKRKGVIEYEDGINDGIKRYSDRHLKRLKTGKALSDHPYVVEFFPAELHPALGVKADGKSQSKLKLARYQDSLETGAEHEDGDGEAAARLKLLSSFDADAETAPPANDDDDDDDDDAGDADDYEEDEFEEDEDGDYNAERYFDDGVEDYDEGGDDEAAY